MSTESSKPKTVSFGDYTITGRLGEGGMCHVFRARKKGESTDCALKLLKEDQRADERVLDLFVTEADLSLLLHHPNLVETFDAGEVNGRYYIAMELIEGANLKEIITECERIGVELPPDLGMFIVSEMLEGLEAVHNVTGHSGAALGLVHRDVTPHNIFVSFDGRVILGDLGIAHITAYGEAEVGTAIGKIGYLSPEQACAEPIDARSDLFSAGVILFELLTNQRLYEGENEAQVIADIAEGKVPKLRKLRPNISRGLEAMMKKAMMRKPKDRYANAEEMVIAMEPHWSPEIANPRVLAGLMSGLFRERAREFREKRMRLRGASESGRPTLPLIVMGEPEQPGS